MSFLRNPNCFFIVALHTETIFYWNTVERECSSAMAARAEPPTGSSAAARRQPHYSGAQGWMRVSLILFDDFPDFPKIWHLQTAVTLRLLDRFQSSWYLGCLIWSQNPENGTITKTFGRYPLTGYQTSTGNLEKLACFKYANFSKLRVDVWYPMGG